MKFILYVAGMPFDGNTLKEIRDDSGALVKSAQSLGGSETMGFYVARELAKRKHSVFCFCNVPDGQPKSIDGVQYIPIGQPSQQFPFGENFEKYAMAIPHDVLLGQRLPALFSKNYNSKLNYWWTHDLALYRSIQLVNAQIWNVDRTLGVSQFHADQVKEVYGFANVDFLPNAVDRLLYGQVDKKRKLASKTLVYSSRPERGLDLLVKEGGIMEQLAEVDQEIRLVVCGYDHTTEQTAPLYHYLWTRCNALPNVMNAGPLSKQDLAELQMNSWLHVYPTADFEETSCITAMEESFAGTPMVACEIGALPETLKDGGVYWSKPDEFVKSITYLNRNPGKWEQLHKKALAKSGSFTIENTVNVLEAMIDEDFKKKTADKDRLLRHFVYYSDAVAAKALAEKYGLGDENLFEEFSTLSKNTTQTVEFYNSQSEYHVKIENKHNLGNFNDILSYRRIMPVVTELKKLAAGSIVLDYGCCVGQNTFAFAHAFPELRFVGVDISNDQIGIGQKFGEEHNIKNVTLKVATSPGDVITDGGFDAIICQEVLEHIDDYHGFITDLEKCCRVGGKVIMSTPSGPHDRTIEGRTVPIEHLHHFEESDLLDIIGHMGESNFNIIYAKDPNNKWGERLGNLIWSWTVGEYGKLGKVDYNRKFKVQKPRQTVSVCMIVGPDGDTLAKTLKSVFTFADEFVIGVDTKQKDLSNAENIARAYGATMFRLPDSPTKIGFDYCRNLTLGLATKDWIVWIDDDETFQWPEKLPKFLRDNEFDSYAIHQHHYTIEPPGVMKTDLPCRIFRNGKGIKFFGLVHEHPETEMNAGAGKSFLLLANEVCIAHNGYDTEAIRRNRFIRNWPLMLRDRQENPERTLGKYLWIRDLVHVNRFELEQNGMQVTPEMLNRCREAIDMFKTLLDTKGTARNVRDSLQYVSECVNMVTNGKGCEFRFCFDSKKMGVGDDMNNAPGLIQGVLESKEDIEKLIQKMIDEKVDQLEKVAKYI